MLVIAVLHISASNYIMSTASLSEDNIEDVFIETAEEIYQNIQDGK